MDKEAKRILVPKDVDGISHYNPYRKTFVIYYRPDGVKGRFRFTIGREIDRIQMGHGCESELGRRIAELLLCIFAIPYIADWSSRMR